MTLIVSPVSGANGDRRGSAHQTRYQPVQSVTPGQSLLFGTSRYMARKRLECERLGPHRCSLLIVGETGTGKAQVADELFRHFQRRHEAAKD